MSKKPALRLQIPPPRREQPVPAKAAGRVSARRGYRYHRRHTPHFYIVIAALSGAGTVCGLDAAAFVTRSVTMANVAFAAVCVTSLLVCAAFFWGFYMVMAGNIPVKRLKVLLPHATVGVLSPLLYTLNISIELEGLGSETVGGPALACGIACFALLCVQFAMGRAVVRPDPLRVIPRSSTGETLSIR